MFYRSRNELITLIVFLFVSGNNDLIKAFTPLITKGKPWCNNGLRSTKTEPKIAMVTTCAEVVKRYEEQMDKMREKDKKSIAISKDDLKVVHSDDHIIVVEKPSNILCVSGKGGNPSLSQAVFDNFGGESESADKMVVHRLGMDTSGLIVFARNINALRSLNTAFRTRKIVRKYEALLCGHVEEDEGEINMPLMRDFANPPYMRVSTDDHQKLLVDLEEEGGLPPHVAKKILQLPKNSITKFKVLSREELDGNPVTKVSLTSVSGRTHQLNVHTAAFGHPIVGDKVYGINGEASPHGGLDDKTLNEIAPNRASSTLQEALNAASTSMCIHASYLSFKHPVTAEDLTFESPVPF